jgi:hypothetical protein
MVMRNYHVAPLNTRVTQQANCSAIRAGGSVLTEVSWVTWARLGQGIDGPHYHPDRQSGVVRGSIEELAHLDGRLGELGHG